MVTCDGLDRTGGEFAVAFFKILSLPIVDGLRETV
jgi:hypothetical protein